LDISTYKKTPTKRKFEVGVKRDLKDYFFLCLSRRLRFLRLCLAILDRLFFFTEAIFTLRSKSFIFEIGLF